MPEQTMQEAAKELHSAVTALKELVEREYPSRREVERRFLTKERAKKNTTIFLVMILVSVPLSFLTSVVTVSTCFRGTVERPSVCKIFPGYEESLERSRLRDERLDKLEELARRYRAENRGN